MTEQSTTQHLDRRGEQVPVPAPHGVWPDIERIPIPPSLDALLAQTVALYGDQEAWTFVGLDDHPWATLSYQELDAVIGRMAAALSHIGVEAGSRVGTLLPNVPEFPALWLALGRLGACIVPVNPKYTAREVDHVAKTSEVTHFVCTAELAATFASAPEAHSRVSAERLVICGSGKTDVAGVRLDVLLDQTAGQTAAAAPAEPERLLNLQFTSGSTGLPKACMLTHSYWELIGLVMSELAGAPARILAEHPFFYMQNQAYLAMALWSGASIVVMPGMSRSKFNGWIRDHQIDYVWHVESLDGLTGPEDGVRLRFVSTAGVHGPIVEHVEHCVGAPLRDWYGSTEIGMGIAVPADRGDLMAKSGTLGFAAPFREVQIIDEEQKPLGPGQRGELCFRGPGIMLGYYGQDEVNQSLFIPGVGSEPATSVQPTRRGATTTTAGCGTALAEAERTSPPPRSSRRSCSSPTWSKPL